MTDGLAAPTQRPEVPGPGPAPWHPARGPRWPRPGFAIWFPLAVYALTRAAGAAYLLAAAAAQHRGYADLVTSWDGGWYRQVAEHGYPAALPVDAGGHVRQNAWAFFPLYPLVVKAAMVVSGASFGAVAPLVSLACGGAAVLVMYRLLEETAGRFTASATVLLACTFMAAPVLQLAYSESLALLLVCTTLVLLRRRRYGWVAWALLALALARPVVAVMAPVVALHGWCRRSDGEPFPRRDRRATVLLTLLAVALGLLWPALAGTVTGEPLAWVRSEQSWLGSPDTVPGLAWVAFLWHGLGWPGVAGVLVLLMLVVLVVLRARVWGPELRAWALAYPVYLLGATAPVPSIIRFLLLGFPLMWPFPGEPATGRERRRRVAMVLVLAVVGLAAQWLWVADFVAVIAPSKRYP